MLKSQTLIFLFILILLSPFLSETGIRKNPNSISNDQQKKITSNTFFSPDKLNTKAAEAKIFIQANTFNEQICFLVDMSNPSGKKRFYVYDMKNDTVKASGLVTHGRCNQLWLEGRRYSNEAGSGCSSLGKYKIGNSYFGKFGLAFKLYGLDKTNDNVFKRYVVLHAHECVPDAETSDEICQSDGCPTVSPSFLKTIKPLLLNSSLPILLWIYE